MKKNRLIFIICIVILVLIIIFFLLFRKKDAISSNITFTNKILHYGFTTISDGKIYSDTFVFLEDGKFYYFPNQIDASASVKGRSGTYKKNNDGIRLEYLYEVYIKDGSLVDNDDNRYTGSKKLVGGSLDIRKLDRGQTINLNSKVITDESYNYFKIDDNDFYVIYDSKSVDDLNNKLEEMYKEVFKMLKSAD